MKIRDLPRSAWKTIIRQTVLVAVISVAISAAVAQLALSTLSQGLDGPGLAVSIALPLLIGGPFSFWHFVRVQQLRLANQQLHILASTDWLTTCLNRRAFTHAVDDALHLPPTQQAAGAFLLIDADHFKLVNDRYGHDRGDEALQLMADVIRSKVRDGDLVGRIGGEEFGVFLRHADLETAALIAERIRNGIRQASFTPDGTVHPLSVTAGGTMIEDISGFTELFRIADRRLYAAKQAGRNRVLLGPAKADLPDGFIGAGPGPALDLAVAG